VELVSGWSDDKYVYLVERNGAETVRVRRVQAKWSAFFSGLDDSDRLTLQRASEVTGVSVRGRYTRVDFRNRWARRDIVRRMEEVLVGSRAGGNTEAAILEADVNPLRRFLSDFGHVNVSSNPRVAWFDLETDSRVSFVDATEHGRARILCWSIAEVVNGQPQIVATGMLEGDNDQAERKLVEDMLLAMAPYDVLLAWSGAGFDFPVLERRASLLRCKLRGLSPAWARWCFLDAMEVFKKYHAHVHESGAEKTSFKLDSIAQAVVGEGKKDFAVSRTWESWVAGGAAREQLLEYNCQDTLLMPKIELKTGYIALHVAVCAVTRCFPDNRSLMASQQGDGFLLRLGEIYNHRWPTKTGGNEESHYAGAYVMEPTRTGIIDDVHVADFASLYPSIIRSWNISPETVRYRLEDERCCTLPHTDTVKFSLAERGMFPRALDELVTRRSEYSRKQDEAEPGSKEWDRYKRLSGAYKIVANSFYGIMGSPFTRFFNSAAAEAVTQTGAWLIKSVGARSNEAGLEAFYGDTDSVFVSGQSERFTQVVAELNAGWQGLMESHGCEECHLRLEFEKSFSRIVLVSAKRYVGRFSVYKGKPITAKKVEVKGLEYKRGDTTALARDMQKQLIDILLGDERPNVEVCREFVKTWKQRVLEGQLAVEDIVLSQSVKSLAEYADRYTTARCGNNKGKHKCGYTFTSTSVTAGPEKCPRCGTERKKAAQPVHVRVAKVLAERGEEIRSGTRIEYLIISGSGDHIEAVPARDAGMLEKIDREYYWNSRIYPPSSRVLDSAFPGEPWTETGKQRKARELQEAIARNRGVIHDLPLFAERPSRVRVRMRKVASQLG
jgi:DNA polymerase elongation subunit (family B)